MFGNVHLFLEVDDRLLRWILDNAIARAGDFEVEEKERLALGHVDGEGGTDEGAGIIIEVVGGKTVVQVGDLGGELGSELAVGGLGGELDVDGVGSELAVGGLGGVEVDGIGSELAVGGLGGELDVDGVGSELAVGGLGGVEVDGVGSELAVGGLGGELDVDGVSSELAVGGELDVHKQLWWAELSVHFVAVAVVGTSKVGVMTLG